MAYRDLHQEVTDRILAELEKGTLPWVKRWSSSGAAGGFPVNASTERPYSGCNIVLLWMAMQTNPTWTVNRFLTYRQAAELGGNVMKGEHGTKVYFWKPYLAKDRRQGAEPDDVVKALVMREYTVFNVAQCENLPARATAGRELRVRNPDTRDELADAYVEATGIELKTGGEAYYVPSADFISMPTFEAFKTADDYYATMFHEMVHWTGSKKRLDRLSNARFGSSEYALEELVAELGAAFQCAEFGFDGDVRHAAYIANWIRALKEDKRAFFTAASAAQKAVDFLRGKALEEPAQLEAA